MKINGSGFYKLEDDELLYGKQVIGPYFQMLDQHDLPQAGWAWYEDETQAREALGLPPVDQSQA